MPMPMPIPMLAPLLLVVAGTASCAAPAPGEPFLGPFPTLEASPSEGPVVAPLFASPSVSAQAISTATALPLHVHERHEETVYVVAGRGRMRMGEEWFEIGPGTLVHVPRGTPHAVEPEGVLTGLSLFTPAFDGIDRLFLGAPEPR